MKIVCYLSWFDEEPQWLYECVTSMARISEHVVAVDGAYEAFPEAESHSPEEQVAAIRDAAVDNSLNCTIYQPAEPYEGQEIEKRSIAVRLANSFCEEKVDWITFLDGDELLWAVPGDLEKRLKLARGDQVGQVTIWTPPMPPPKKTGEASRQLMESGNIFWCGRFFLSMWDMYYAKNHWTLYSHQRKLSWDHNGGADFRDVVIYHRQPDRRRERKLRQRAYYEIRNERELEEMLPLPKTGIA